MREQKSLLSLTQSIAPAARTATVNGTGVDLTGADAATVLFYFGAYTDGTHTFKLQESADNSTFTDVASTDLIGTAPAVTTNASQNSIAVIAYIGSKRYIRPVSTVSGTTTGAIYGVGIVGGYLSKAT